MKKFRTIVSEMVWILGGKVPVWRNKTAGCDWQAVKPRWYQRVLIHTPNLFITSIQKVTSFYPRTSAELNNWKNIVHFFSPFFLKKFSHERLRHTSPLQQLFSDSRITLCADARRQMCLRRVCTGRVFVKPFNINEYNISGVINKPDSLAPREAYYPGSENRLSRLPFVIHLDSDRWLIQR